MELQRPSILNFLFIVKSLFDINLIDKFLIHFHYTKCMSEHFTFFAISVFATALKHPSTALFTNFTCFSSILKLTLSKSIFINCFIVDIWAMLHHHILRRTQLINVWKAESTNWMDKPKRVINLWFFLLLMVWFLKIIV